MFPPHHFLRSLSSEPQAFFMTDHLLEASHRQLSSASFPTHAEEPSDVRFLPEDGDWSVSLGQETNEDRHWYSKKVAKRYQPPKTEILPISGKDASFILGIAGKTKDKLSRVCGADLNVVMTNGKTAVEITGSPSAIEKARLYIGFVMQQRVGTVSLPEGYEARDDLTLIEIPYECVGYVTGRKGNGLRSVEEEWGTLMFFTDLRSGAGSGNTERLAIFGEERARKGAAMKVMSAVEQKIPGYFTQNNQYYSDKEGFDTDMVPIKEEDYSYALGQRGATRKKLATASGAILEYIGRVAFIAGTKRERQRARQYLQWICAQRTSYVHVDTSKRDDVLVAHLTKDTVAYVTGTKGNNLRRIEEYTGTFIFLDGQGKGGDERLLILGNCAKARLEAERLVNERVEEKLTGRARPEGRRFSRYHPYSGSRSRSPPQRFYPHNNDRAYVERSPYSYHHYPPQDGYYHRSSYDRHGSGFQPSRNSSRGYGGRSMYSHPYGPPHGGAGGGSSHHDSFAYGSGSGGYSSGGGYHQNSAPNHHYSEPPHYINDGDGPHSAYRGGGDHHSHHHPSHGYGQHTTTGARGGEGYGMRGYVSGRGGPGEFPPSVGGRKFLRSRSPYGQPPRSHQPYIREEGGSSSRRQHTETEPSSFSQNRDGGGAVGGVAGGYYEAYGLGARSAAEFTDGVGIIPANTPTAARGGGGIINPGGAHGLDYNTYNYAGYLDSGRTAL